ncbi:MAG: protoporphyrinogen oxidase [bacterium]|nr:MAG: protoporphyrinogen oxidase [bacterium]
MPSSPGTRRVVVIGGGISGLSAAYYIRQLARTSDLPVEVILLEKERRVGGKFIARREDGYLVEGGPNGFLDSKPWTLDLVRDMGMESSLLPSDQAAARRFIFSRGKLHELKASPLSFFLSDLLSLRGRLRIFGELVAPTTPPGEDTSLAEFARRRLGKEALERMLDPMVSGIFAGDPERMSLRACFPRIAELEEDYGGLVRAMVKIAAERKRAKRAGEQVPASSGPSGPGGVLTSFRGGVSELSDRLAESLGEGVRTAVGVSSVATAGGGWHIGTDRGDISSDAVILATPADAAAAILAGAAPRSAAVLAEIPYSPMAVIGLGYSLANVDDPPHGFGYLIPGIERRKILGALWTSSIFPGNRSPERHFLIRAMVGGAKDHDTPFLDDETLVAVVRRELAATMGLVAEPSFVTVFRWEKAIPLYTVGHLERLARAESLLPPGLVLTGNAYRGVGINDCVRESKVSAQRVLDHLFPA